MDQSNPSHIAQLFASRLQAEILARLLLHDGAMVTAAELVGEVEESRATVFRELRRLTQMGVLSRDGAGRYRAAADSPLHRPLRDLFERTVGVEDALREGLERIEGVEAAAIFGDWARGVVAGPGPIRLLIVGTPDRAALDALAGRVGRRAGRQVTPVVWTREELDQELSWSTGFVAEITREALVPLVGTVTSGGAPAEVTPLPLPR